MSDLLQRAIRQAVLAAFLALAPSYVPDWRADPSVRTVAVLPVGEPMASFAARPAQRMTD